jgi:outer membrane lipoprotein SlyB
MKQKNILLAVAGLVVLTACQANTERQADANCVVGTAGGAAVGGLVGNQIGGGTGNTLATIAGATGGALLGSNVACQ